MAYDFPSSPGIGQTFTPAIGGPTYVWQPPVWRIASGGVNSGVYVGEYPPANPVQGQLWFNSATGATFIYFVDVDSSAWVQFNVAPPLEADHLSSVAEDMWAGFKPTGQFLVNNQSDASGDDLFSVNRSGYAVLKAPAGAVGYASLEVYGNPTGTGANSNSGILQFKASGGTRRGYLLWEHTNARFEIISDNGPVLLGSMNHNVNFMTAGSSVWYMNSSTFGSTALGSVASIKTVYAGLGTAYGISVLTAQASGLAAVWHTNVGTVVGSVSVTASNTTYVTTSDERLKTFADPYDGDEAIAVIKADPVRNYIWNNDPDAGEQVGWGAQTSYEVDNRLAVPPQPADLRKRKAGEEEAAVNAENADDPNLNPWGMDYGRRAPFLWAALARAIEKIETLEAKVAALEGAR